MGHQRLLEFALAARVGGAEEVEEVRILEDLGGQVRLGGGRVSGKLVMALPWRWWARPPIWSTRMLCDQPCSLDCRAYQSRSAGSSSFSKRAMW